MPGMVRRPLGGFTGLLNRRHHFYPCFLQPVAALPVSPGAAGKTAPGTQPQPKKANLDLQHLLVSLM